MAQLTVRKVPVDIVRALKVRAAQRGHSAEAEHREILRRALAPKEPEVPFEDYLLTMPDVGRDEDFARIEGTIRDVDLEP